VGFWCWIRSPDFKGNQQIFPIAKFSCQKVLTKGNARSNILPVKKTTWMCR
jgi:hypothetical protein